MDCVRSNGAHDQRDCKARDSERNRPSVRKREREEEEREQDRVRQVDVHRNACSLKIAHNYANELQTDCFSTGSGGHGCPKTASVACNIPKSGPVPVPVAIAAPTSAPRAWHWFCRSTLARSGRDATESPVCCSERE